MEQKFNILTWFKNLADAWKIGATIVGAVITIGYAAIKIDHWFTKGVKQENVITYLDQESKNNKKLDHIKDSIEIKHWADLYVKLGHYSDSLNLLFNNTQTLTNAVGTIGSKMTSTVPDLFKLMGGLQFKIVEEVSNKSVYPGAIIKYMKIDTTKHK